MCLLNGCNDVEECRFGGMRWCGSSVYKCCKWGNAEEEENEGSECCSCCHWCVLHCCSGGKLIWGAFICKSIGTRSIYSDSCQACVVCVIIWGSLAFCHSIALFTFDSVIHKLCIL